MALVGHFFAGDLGYGSGRDLGYRSGLRFLNLDAHN
jgi:hypothetical protein